MLLDISVLEEQLQQPQQIIQLKEEIYVQQVPTAQPEVQVQFLVLQDLTEVLQEHKANQIVHHVMLENIVKLLEELQQLEIVQ